MNNINIIGNLGRDPESRTTQTGKKVVNFSIAVQDDYNKDTTYWFNVQAWGKTADFVEAYLTKGRKVAVSGRLTQRKYETSDGQKREAIEIVADKVYGLDKPSAEGKSRTTTPAATEPEFDPFADE